MFLVWCLNWCYSSTLWTVGGRGWFIMQTNCKIKNVFILTLVCGICEYDLWAFYCRLMVAIIHSPLALTWCFWSYIPEHACAPNGVWLHFFFLPAFKLFIHVVCVLGHQKDPSLSNCRSEDEHLWYAIVSLFSKNNMFSYRTWLISLKDKSPVFRGCDEYVLCSPNRSIFKRKKYFCF